MTRIIFLTLMALIAGAVVQQYSTIQELAAQLDAYQGKVEALETAQANNAAATILLKRLSLANSKKLQTLHPKRVLTVTAYSPRNEETDASPFTTASNRRVRHGIIAVSRDLFDDGWVFGKKVYVKGLGVFTIDDLMADTKRNQIDIFMFDTKAAVDFGRMTAEAYLLDMEPLPQTADAGI
ncbi:MAG: 3D domain-containing protein [Desulfovibrionaceae bacterium]